MYEMSVGLSLAKGVKKCVQVDVAALSKAFELFLAGIVRLDSAKESINDGHQRALKWSAPSSLDQRRIVVQAEAILPAAAKTYLSYSDVVASGSCIARIHASYCHLQSA
ncbi:hypothetical protein NQZ79_g3503 [Umbelopsis isabellina]|nr:hypothetical protein NQZ79_g3503 [Umbelopsis isabellina]